MMMGIKRGLNELLRPPNLQSPLPSVRRMEDRKSETFANDDEDDEYDDDDDDEEDKEGDDDGQNIKVVCLSLSWSVSQKLTHPWA